MPQPVQHSFNIRTGSGGDVYFSGSWNPGNEETTAFHVVKALDQANFRAVGDIDKRYGFPMEDDRIRRIMRQCSGFVGVFPHRPDLSTTSKYVIREARIAAEMRLPMILFHEPSVRLELKSSDNAVVLSFPGDPAISGIPLPATCFGPISLNADPRILDQMISAQLQGLIEFCSYEVAKPQPYAFFITRLKEDFAQARAAVEAAVHNSAGITCLWADDGKYGSQIQNVQSNIIELIRSAEFVIADLSFSDENPTYDNPNRAHEIGISRGLGKTIFVCSHGLSRSPYFSARDLQVSFWKTEKDFERLVSTWLENNINEFGRQVYNWMLPAKLPGYQAHIQQKVFVFDAATGFVFPPSTLINPHQPPSTLINLHKPP